MKVLSIGLMVLTCLLTLSSAIAEQEVLKFRLVTHNHDSPSLKTPAEGHTLSMGKSTGVAIFEDGRIADKQFVSMLDNGGAIGEWVGYSTYTFENGDSITLKFTGGWNADGVKGIYEILSGTGKYEGATGEGQFTPLKNPWDNASLWDVTLNVTLSGG